MLSHAIRRLALAMTIVTTPASAFAQSGATPPQPLPPASRIERSFATLDVAPPAANTFVNSQPPGRDNLKNGTLWGTLLGAVAGGAVWYGICRAMDDSASGTGDCWEPELAIAIGVGAAAGAGLGAAIDAARSSGHRLRLTIRF